jgi:hypothetical protein
MMMPWWTNKINLGLYQPDDVSMLAKKACMGRILV